MSFSKPINEIIQERFSCRTYLDQPIDPGVYDRLNAYVVGLQAVPHSTELRFALVSASEGDAKSLRGLGTYGVIKGAKGFIIGAMPHSDKNLEDFGYLMELIILKATDLGLGTCWLGGTFTKSRFAEKISLLDGESIPAVTSLGYIAKKPRWVDGKIREMADSDRRLPWERLFFDQHFEAPLSQENVGEYQLPLEMVRMGPSASNRQPWRIVKDGNIWHFYLRRTRGYQNTNFARITKMADLQRIDIGIAMCHFELTARELGLAGEWQISDPEIVPVENLTEYSVSWVDSTAKS